MPLYRPSLVSAMLILLQTELEPTENRDADLPDHLTFTPGLEPTQTSQVDSTNGASRDICLQEVLLPCHARLGCRQVECHQSRTACHRVGISDFGTGKMNLRTSRTRLPSLEPKPSKMRLWACNKSVSLHHGDSFQTGARRTGDTPPRSSSLPTLPNYASTRPPSE